MLVELDLQSGCRWGEITELRGRDIKRDPDARDRVYLDLTRAVTDIGAASNPLRNGGRFYIEDTTKGGHDRRIGLSVAMTDKLLAYLDQNTITGDQLLFPLSRLTAELDTNTETAPPPQPPEDLGRTPPNTAGRTYAHGTITGYSLGACHCQWCRHAYASYRAKRRAAGKDRRPAKDTKAGRNLTDHLPRDWFRNNMWTPALKTAGLTSRKIVFHDLRHTHATWLARSHKIDIERLRERMGHRSILTTQQYISAATTIDTTAADVMDGLLASADP
jgi:integrase